MKYIVVGVVVMAYMFLSGMIGATLHNSYHERCGTTGNIVKETALEFLLWPIDIGFVVKVNPSTFQETKCKENK